MKSLRLLSCLALAVITLATCSKDEVGVHTTAEIKTLGANDIDEYGVTLRANVNSIGTDPILQYGFLWSSSNPDLYGHRVIKQGQPKLKRISYRIWSGMFEGNEYQAKAFLITATDTIYGDEISFRSKGCRGPYARSVYPAEAGRGDTLTVIGDGFSYLTHLNTVRLRPWSDYNTLRDHWGYEAEVIHSTDTLLRFVVPDKYNGNSKVQVEWFDKKSLAPTKITGIDSKITGIFPKEGSFRDTVIIRGSKLGSTLKGMRVEFNWDDVEVLSVAPAEIKVVVPTDAYRKNKVRINAYGTELKDAQYFYLKEPVITGIEPTRVTERNGEFTVRGKYFNPEIKYNDVGVDNSYTEEMECSTTHIKVRLSDGVIPQKYVSVNKEVDVKLRVRNMDTISPVKLRIDYKGQWSRKKTFPGDRRAQAVGFSIGNYGYLGLGTAGENLKGLYDFWKFDSTNESWSRISNFPGKGRVGASSFVLNGKAYVGMGHPNEGSSLEGFFKDFYRYDPATDKWEQLNDFPGYARKNATCFVIDGVAHMICGVWGKEPASNYYITKEHWIYDAENDEWTKTTPFIKEKEDLAVCVNNDTAYAFDWRSIYKYENGNWILVDDDLSDYSTFDTSFSINGKIYYGLGNKYNYRGYTFYEYDLNKKEYIRKDMSQDHRRTAAASFVVNNKAYVIGGYNYKESKMHYLNDVWEFDPSVDVGE